MEQIIGKIYRTSDYNKFKRLEGLMISQTKGLNLGNN